MIAGEHVDALLDRPQSGVGADEWLFVAWAPDASCGVISGHRLIGKRAWYWSAHVRAGYRLLTLDEWEVSVRPDPMVVKAPEMWAEHICEVPLQQWSIGNEAYFVELDSPDEAKGRAYGIPRPTAFDLEWYATGNPIPLDELAAHARRPNQQTSVNGFGQAGVVHGTIEVLDRDPVELVEAPAFRWRRWSASTALPPVRVSPVVAHTGLRSVFAFPDGSMTDWVLNTDGWHERVRPIRTNDQDE